MFYLEDLVKFFKFALPALTVFGCLSAQPAFADAILPAYGEFNPADVLFDAGSGFGDCSGDVLLDTTSSATCNSLTFTYDISPPFDSALHSLVNATLTLYLYDDDLPSGPRTNPQPDNEGERFDLSLDLDDLVFDNQDVEETSTFGSPTIWPSVAGLDVKLLLTDGELVVEISRQNGDFKFDKSILQAEWQLKDEGNEEEPVVPEPASLMLFGTGLAAVSRFARRRQNVD